MRDGNIGRWGAREREREGDACKRTREASEWKQKSGRTVKKGSGEMFLPLSMYGCTPAAPTHSARRPISSRPQKELTVIPSFLFLRIVVKVTRGTYGQYQRKIDAEFM